MSGSRWGHAVVVGGAHAGLLTAHVLAEHFARVTVCERDLINEDTEFHPGVPQARHPHAVLARGAELLEARFPGLRTELGTLGAPVYDAGLGVRYRLPSGRLPVSALGVKIQNVSRTTLERALRRRVLAHPRVELRAGFVVEGLDRDRASGTVTGVTDGQGLTVAAQEAQLLGELLEGTRTLSGLAPAFQRRLGGLIRLPWSMATSSDLFWDPAPPSRSARLIRWYLNQLLDLVLIDPEVATRFVQVQNMISSPAALVVPRMIARVLRQSLRPRPDPRCPEATTDELYN